MKLYKSKNYFIKGINRAEFRNNVKIVLVNPNLEEEKLDKKFEKNFYFFRRLYDIRSAAIHRSDWLSHSEKIFKILRNKGWEFSNMEQMFGMIKKIIKNNYRKTHKT